MSNVELLFGPLLIGVFLNTILYGVLVVQTLMYFQTYKEDKPWIRYFILYLFILETLNTGFDIGLVYEPLIVRYTTPMATIRMPVMLSADGIVTVMIATPVQLFIGWRISIFCKSKLIARSIVFFSISSFLGGGAVTICSSLRPEYTQFHSFQGAVIAWLASSAITDIIITTSLVWSLHRSRCGVKTGTDDVVKRIIRLTVQTGMLTAISAAADVIFFLAIPDTTLNFIPDFALSKLYTNSLLSTLNARASWRNILFREDSSNITAMIKFAPRVSHVGESRGRRSSISSGPGVEPQRDSVAGTVSVSKDDQNLV